MPSVAMNGDWDLVQIASNTHPTDRTVHSRNDQLFMPNHTTQCGAIQVTPSEHSEIVGKLNILVGAVGHEENGGTGLTGRTMRTEAKVELLMADRNLVRSGLVIIGAIGTLILTNMKGWGAAVVAFFSHGAHG